MNSAGLRRRDVLLAVSVSGGTLSLSGCTGSDQNDRDAANSLAGAAMAIDDGYGAGYGHSYGTE